MVISCEDKLKYPYNKAFFFAYRFLDGMLTTDKFKKNHPKTEDI